MPRRSRPPQVDRIARDVFRFLIPRNWSFERIEPDYGIGCGVVIHDTPDPANRLAGRSGLRCHVQLTVSEAPAPSEALALTLPEERLRYYATLSPPVLMVRYHAPGGAFFARWVHQNPGSCVPRKSVPKRGATFTWVESDRWSERTPVWIENDLRRMRPLREPGFPWPMRFTLNVEAEGLSERMKSRIVSAIREKWGRMSRYVALVDDGARVDGSITISPTMLRAAMGGFPSVSVPLEAYRLTPDTLQRLLADALVLIAIALTRAGYAEMAARLCELCFERRASTT